MKEIMGRSNFWRRVVPLILLFILGRYIWIWMTDLPQVDSQMDMEFIGKNSVQQTFKGKSCVMKDGICVPENVVDAPTRGLRADRDHFLLNGKPFRILSGSFHYFRTHPKQWYDRLLKMKAAGLNTVSTYIPWNLHEKNEGEFDFAGLWDIVAFIKAVDLIGLKLIVRPGPYICSEWEFGGLPSWLLREKNRKLRSSEDKIYMQKVERYFARLLPILVPYQYSQGSGPIIAFQVENEFGHYNHDIEYMSFLQSLFLKAGITEMLFTSDNGHYLRNGRLPGTFMMVNFASDPEYNFGELRRLQPNRTQMVAEYWVGWFDHWGEDHHTVGPDKLVTAVGKLLDTGASINFYMFVGGTNFEFWNGANFGLPPTITSYDYDAPISEAGDFTAKAEALRDLFLRKNLIAETDIPALKAPFPKKVAYAPVTMTQVLSYADVADMVKQRQRRFVLDHKKLEFMELLNFTNGGVAGYGWMLYQAKINKGGKLEIDGTFRGRAQIFFNSRQIGLFDKKTLENIFIPDVSDTATLDILVENTGRVNYGRGIGIQSLDSQNMGIQGTVSINGNPVVNWECIPLEFHRDFNRYVLPLSNQWKPFETKDYPAAYRGHFTINGEPADTFINMKRWTKGIVLVNGFNIGRYWNRGPQQTLYVPYPMLAEGKNEFVVFELHKPSTELIFTDKPILDGI